jgi:alpha-L-arabinofuranosidase
MKAQAVINKDFTVFNIDKRVFGSFFGAYGSGGLYRNL